MFWLLFGSIFLTVAIFIFIMCLFLNFLNIFIIIFLIPFFVIGLITFIMGLSKYLKDKATDKNGEECFGCVNKVEPSNMYINDNPVFKAEFKIYIQSEHSVKLVTDDIGTDYSKFPVGSFAKLKYYNGDINVVGSISPIEVPDNIMKQIQVATVYKEDIIEVNGAKYKRVD